MRKASVVAASVAAATAGSAMLGGVALAWGGHHDSSIDRGGDGTGGKATNNCLNVGIPILSGNGVLGQGDAKGATCNATANGTGGSAY
jgi:hypothetical protein